jgi:hypothetical protein
MPLRHPEIIPVAVMVAAPASVLAAIGPASVPVAVTMAVAITVAAVGSASASVAIPVAVAITVAARDPAAAPVPVSMSVAIAVAARGLASMAVPVAVSVHPATAVNIGPRRVEGRPHAAEGPVAPDHLGPAAGRATVDVEVRPRASAGRRHVNLEPRTFRADRRSGWRRRRGLSPNGRGQQDGAECSVNDGGAHG